MDVDVVVFVFLMGSGSLILGESPAGLRRFLEHIQTFRDQLDSAPPWERRASMSEVDLQPVRMFCRVAGVVLILLSAVGLAELV